MTILEQHYLWFSKNNTNMVKSVTPKTISQSLIHSDVHTRGRVSCSDCFLDVHVWFDFCLHAKNEPTKRVNVKTLFIFTSVLNVGSKLHHSVSVKLMDVTTSTKGRFIFSSLKIFKHFWGGFGIMYKIKLHWKLCLPIRQTCKTCFTTKGTF